MRNFEFAFGVSTFYLIVGIIVLVSQDLNLQNNPMAIYDLISCYFSIIILLVVAKKLDNNIDLCITEFTIFIISLAILLTFFYMPKSQNIYILAYSNATLVYYFFIVVLFGKNLDDQMQYTI